MKHEAVGTVLGEDGSFSEYFVISDDDFDGSEDEGANLPEYIEQTETFQSYRCHHEHDCCGCFFSHGTSIVGFDDLNWIVVKRHYRNI